MTDAPHVSARSTDSPPLRNRQSSGSTSASAGSHSEPAIAPTAHRASTNTLVSAADAAHRASQKQRLLQIESSTVDRLDEIRKMVWLGEVAALEESLRHIRHKRQQLERAEAQTKPPGR